MADFILYKPKQAILLPASFQVPSDVEFKEVEFRGKGVKVVKDNLKTYYALKPSLPDLDCPIYRHYDWPLYKSKFPPMSHQKITAGFIAENPKNLVLSSTGTGKTFSILLAYKYLLDEGFVDKMIVIAPLSVLNVWALEAFGSFLELPVTTLHGTAAKRRDMMRLWASIYVTNFEGLKVLEKDFDTFVDKKTYLVVDEASKLTNPKNVVYQKFSELAKKVVYMTLSTATPTSKAPSQAWALARLTNKETPRWFGQFRDMVEYKINQFVWANKPNCNEIVNKYLQPSILFHKDECLDLPPLTISYSEVPLSKKQEEIYKKVKREMAATLASGEEVTAVNAAHTIGVLRQTCLGVVKVAEKEYAPIDADEDGGVVMFPRLQAILDIAEGADSKMIVVVPFTGAIRHYHSVISKHFTCEYVDGSVKKDDRNDVFDRFQNTNSIKILLVNPKVASHGVNLQSCPLLCFAGPIFSVDESIQLRGRIERSGQLHPMTIIRIYANSLEKSIYDRIDDRDFTQRELLDMYKQEVETT